VKLQVCGKQILIDQILIDKQLGVSCEGMIPQMQLSKRKAHLEEDYKTPHFCEK